MSKDRKCQTTGGLWCLLLFSGLSGLVSSKCCSAPAGSGTSAHAADLADAFSWFPCWTQLNHTSHSQDWNSDGKMLRTFLSLWCWGSALVTIQPSSSGYHQIFLTMVQDHLISNTAWPLTEGCCPCFFPLWGTWTPCMWCCSLWDCWELVGKACALAQDRLHTGKWELGRNSSDGWYTHPFPSTE